MSCCPDAEKMDSSYLIRISELGHVTLFSQIEKANEWKVIDNVNNVNSVDCKDRSCYT